jgi:hypothetical protein
VARALRRGIRCIVISEVSGFSQSTHGQFVIHGLAARMPDIFVVLGFLPVQIDRLSRSVGPA